MNTQYVAPGATFEALVQGFPTGLAGTLGARIRDNAGADSLARTTAGIVEDIAGSGIYRVTLTAPSAAGQYTIVWDDGSISGPSDVATENLVVTSSALAAGLPGAGDLCTLADVRSAMETQAADTGLDTLAQSYITIASQLIGQDAQREFTVTNAATRDFRVLGAGGGFPIVDLAPFDLRTATTVTLDPLGSPQVLAANTGYQLRPLNGSSIGGVYTELVLSRTLGIAPSSLSDFGTATLRVLGDWGMSAVPVLAKQACVIAVRAWLRRDMSAYAEAADGLDARTLLPSAGGTYALPLAAKTILNPLRRNPIGVM